MWWNGRIRKKWSSGKQVRWCLATERLPQQRSISSIIVFVWKWRSRKSLSQLRNQPKMRTQLGIVLQNATNYHYHSRIQAGFLQKSQWIVADRMLSDADIKQEHKHVFRWLRSSVKPFSCNKKVLPVWPRSFNHGRRTDGHKFIEKIVWTRKAFSDMRKSHRQQTINKLRKGVPKHVRRSHQTATRDPH